MKSRANKSGVAHWWVAPFLLFDAMSRLRPFIFILIGFGVGAGLGLYLGWVAWPTEFSDATPALLEDAYQQEYILMIATTYAQDDNLPQAEQRISSLGAESDAVLLDVTLDMILQAEAETEIRDVVRLAAAMGLYSPAMEPYMPAVEPTP